MTTANLSNRVVSAPHIMKIFNPMSAEWFLLLVISGGFLSYIQHTFLPHPLPHEIIARAILSLQILVLFLIGKTRKRPPPGLLTLAIILFGISSAATLFTSLILGDSLGQAVQAFYFMFNVGIFLLATPFLPLRATGSIGLRMFFTLCLAFGALQVLTQDLLIPTGLRSEFGLAFDRFVNGNIRAVSFFASAPRFAELLVLLSCYILNRILTYNAKNLLFWVAIYAIDLWLLYNTYSRSGYILWISAFLAQILLTGNINSPNNRNPIILLIPLAILGYFAIFWAIKSTRLIEHYLYIADNTSLIARLQHWAETTTNIGQLGIFELLFGSGKAAMFSRSSYEYFVIDNVFLSIISYSGVVGISCFLFLFFEIFRFGYRASERLPTRHRVPLLAFYGGLLIEGQTLDNHNTIFLTQLAIMFFFGGIDFNDRFATPQRAGALIAAGTRRP